MASPAFSMAAKVSLLILADSMALICCSSVSICARVCPMECSWTFLRLNAALAAVSGQLHVFIGPDDARLPVLLVLTCLRARESCSSIWLWRYFSRFCSISSCDRSPRMAFLGLSFRFCWAAPPNQPHIFAGWCSVSRVGGEDERRGAGLRRRRS